LEPDTNERLDGHLRQSSAGAITVLASRNFGNEIAVIISITVFAKQNIRQMLQAHFDGDLCRRGCIIAMIINKPNRALILAECRNRYRLAIAASNYDSLLEIIRIYEVDKVTCPPTDFEQEFPKFRTP
jgi:hypothetical protein